MAHVFVSAVIPAPVAAVWSLIRDFDGLPQWHPGIVASRIEDGLASAQVGCVRRFELARAGGVIRERLLALDDLRRSCTYAILEGPLPVTDYVSTLRLQPVTAGDQTFASWTARFGCDAAIEAEVCATVGQGVFATGLTALQQRFAADLT